MSYHIYTTKGIVLSSRPLREADRIYSILTRDLGLLKASAIGVRKEVSKLRGNLEPISISKVSLVRGKEFWRITSAEIVRPVPPLLEIVRPMTLLEKLVQGEAVNAELFDAIEDSLASDYSSDDMFEVRLASQILFHLGYLRQEDLSLDKKDLIRAINEGIEHSHLG